VALIKYLRQEYEEVLKLAFIYCQKSAEMEDADGTFKVEYFYDEGIGVEKNKRKVFIYYQKYAEMGNACGILLISQSLIRMSVSVNLQNFDEAIIVFDSF